MALKLKNIFLRKQESAQIPILKKNAIKQEQHLIDFEKDGYIVLKSIAKNYIIKLKEVFDQLPPINNGVFNYSLMGSPAQENKYVHDTVSKIIKPLCEDIFIQYKLYSTTFLTKPAKFNEEMLLHQDWSFTDEKIYLPTTLWIPLQDTDDSNGTLFFIPGSHHLIDNYRSHTFPTGRYSSNGILAPYVKSVNAKLGDVILFHPAVFHGSFPNHTQTDRIVISSTVLPSVAPFIHVNKINDHKANISILDDDSFFKNLKNVESAEEFNGKKNNVVKYKHKIPQENEILQLIQTKNGSTK